MRGAGSSSSSSSSSSRSSHTRKNSNSETISSGESNHNNYTIGHIHGENDSNNSDLSSGSWHSSTRIAFKTWGRAATLKGRFVSGLEFRLGGPPTL